jgi:hypothetical protein
MPKAYAYKESEFVHLSIVGDWATIYVPEHRSRYVVPVERIIRYDVIVPKEENSILAESVRMQPTAALEPMPPSIPIQKKEN